MTELSEATLVLRGEVVQILERGGQRFVKLAIREPRAADMVVAMPEDVHLGDDVAIEAHVAVRAITRVGDGPEPGRRAPRHTGGSDD